MRGKKKGGKEEEEGLWISFILSPLSIFNYSIIPPVVER